MEIGVADGSNAKAMVNAAIQNFAPAEVEYYGFDYFSGTRYDRVWQKLEETQCIFKLFRGDTLHTLPIVITTMPKMDLIFIDGGKSFKEAKNDWKCSKTLMHLETAVFVHNYGFSGVRRMVHDIDRNAYQVRIIHPPLDYTTALIKKRVS